MDNDTIAEIIRTHAYLPPNWYPRIRDTAVQELAYRSNGRGFDNGEGRGSGARPETWCDAMLGQSAACDAVRPWLQKWGWTAPRVYRAAIQPGKNVRFLADISPPFCWDHREDFAKIWQYKIPPNPDGSGMPMTDWPFYGSYRSNQAAREFLYQITFFNPMRAICAHDLEVLAPYQTWYDMCRSRAGRTVLDNYTGKKKWIMHSRAERLLWPNNARSNAETRCVLWGLLAFGPLYDDLIARVEARVSPVSDYFRPESTPLGILSAYVAPLDLPGWNEMCYDWMYYPLDRLFQKYLDQDLKELDMAFHERERFGHYYSRLDVCADMLMCRAGWLAWFRDVAHGFTGQNSMDWPQKSPFMKLRKHPAAPRARTKHSLWRKEANERTGLQP